MLKLYNSLTKTKEVLEPIHGDRVGIYSCGPTVYDRVHLGNLRAFLLPDLLQRVIRIVEKKDVEWVMNITDVDDKMIERSKLEFASYDEATALGMLADKYTDIFLEDIEKIGIKRDDISHLPRATDYIESMKALIIGLAEENIAYEKNGSVYFSIEKYRASGKKYGKLIDLDFDSKSHITDDQDQKEGVADFALWKAHKEGEPYWELKINGKMLPGRPGWHIECSAMSIELLGKPFDIHTGGVDLKFPHHENELAQCNGLQANFYLHNEHLSIDSEKMSKSLGNIKTISDLKHPLAFRYMVLSGHYRSQMNFSTEDLESAQTRIMNIRKYFDQLMLAREDQLPEREDSGMVKKFIEEFIAALQDDLNTPKALAALDLILGKVYSKEAKQAIVLFDSIFGFNLIYDVILQDKIIVDLDKYEQARKDKDFDYSDSLRHNILNDYGLVISDTETGPLVHRSK